jgi:valyl-tRNA synthetase
MIMMSLYKTSKVPFNKVLLHGLVRDKNHQKMSKSKNNAVDPIAVCDQYGADVLR